jgi:hypothetical protein
MLKHWLTIITALALAYSSASAQEARVDIGLLICGLGEGAESGGDAMTRETNKMLCVFRPSNNGPEEVYAGAFQTIGNQELSMIGQ